MLDAVDRHSQLEIFEALVFLDVLERFLERSLRRVGREGLENGIWTSFAHCAYDFIKGL